MTALLTWTSTEEAIFKVIIVVKVIKFSSIVTCAIVVADLRVDVDVEFASVATIAHFCRLALRFERGVENFVDSTLSRVVRGGRRPVSRVGVLWRRW
jgi:hypothetical protein